MILQLKGTEPAEEAIEALVEQHGGQLYALAVRFCGTEEEAEDLVQETFLQAFRKWHQFRGASKPSTWLYTIASRTCQRFHRKKSGQPERIESLEQLLPSGDSDVGIPGTSSVDGLTESIRNEATRRIEAAIVGLPVMFRLPLVLKEICGFSLEDVATILGIKEPTVKTRLHRARLRLRQAMEESLPGAQLPPPAYSKRVCMDLLRAKMESLDRGVEMPGGSKIICERCRAVFSSLDDTQDICRDLGRGELPEPLRSLIVAEIRGQMA